MAKLPLNLDEILYILTTLKVHPENLGTDTLESRDKSTQKHLRLLNGIALLLVTEETSDVAAVTLTNVINGNERQVCFHLVKNRPCNDQERAYYNAFLNIINGEKPTSDEILDGLAPLVIENCRPKIMARAKKIKKTANDLSKIGFQWLRPSDAAIKDLASNFDEEELLQIGDMTWPNLLDAWFEKVVGPPAFAQNSSPETSERGLMASYLFKQSDELLHSLKSPKLQRQVQKLAAYWSAIVTIKKETLAIKGKREFTLDLLKSSERVDMSLASAKDLVNRCVTAMEPPWDQFSTTDLKGMAPRVSDTEIERPAANIKSLIHCECELAVQMRVQIRTSMEIGVSKDCCWPCMQFLALLSQDLPKIFVTASHGKVYRGWQFPISKNSPRYHEIYQGMEDRARVALKKFLVTTQERRRSDSHAASSSDEDENTGTVDRMRKYLAKKRSKIMSDPSSVD